VNTIPEEAVNELTKTRRKIFRGRREPCVTVQCIFIIDAMDGRWDGGIGGATEAGKEGGREGTMHVKNAE